jgi:hypothetical protein
MSLTDFYEIVCDFILSLTMPGAKDGEEQYLSYLSYNKYII